MRAKPFISGSLLACVLTLSVPALALGLGKLTVNSGLGQPLSAQIELTAAQRDELDSLRARIADPSVYRDNGAQYVGALARARITVEQGANATYLRVTTSAPVNEPFLNLIIELSWATGRVVRDYTDSSGSCADAHHTRGTSRRRVGRFRGLDIYGARHSRQLHGQARRHPVQDREPV